MSRLLVPIRATRIALSRALANDGIRRLEAAWALGIAADAGLLVVLLVVVYARDGAVATGLLGAFRMLPAIVAGSLAGGIVGRFRGDRALVWLGFVRAAAALACAAVIATGAPIVLLYLLAAVCAGAGAPARPIQATLMPAIARDPEELVAANMTWTTGEGLGALAGPLVAGLLVAAGLPAAGALVAALGFAGTSLMVRAIRFEHAEDMTGGGRATSAVRLVDGLRALLRRPVLAWSMSAIYAQVLTRGLLNSFIVVASVELLGMGDPGVGILGASLGIGGLVGAVFAVGLTRADRLVRTETAALAWWGVPVAALGLVPLPIVGMVAMVVVGVANAVFDVAVITIFQRGSTNEERPAVFSVFEAAAGLGAVTGSLLAPVLLAAFGASAAMAIGGAILPVLALVIHASVGTTDRVTVVEEPTLELLRRVPVFAELPLTAVERLAAGLVPVSFAAGDVVLREGDVGETFVVIERGEVEVSAGGRRLVRQGPGSGIGEIALLRRSPRTATVVALTDVSGFCVDAPTFLAAISGPAAAAVTERIATANLSRSAAAGAPTMAEA